ncbi:hypothetical protein D3C72_1523970 [compost metagenome]
MQQQRCLDLRHILGVSLTAIKRHCGAQLRIRHRCSIGHCAAIAEAGDANLGGGLGVLHQPFDSGEEIVHELLRVDRGLELAAPVVIARVTPHRAQPIGRQRDKSGLGQTPGNVFDVGIEAAVLMDHDNPRHVAFDLGRAYQVATDLTMALG